jgi:hypothetical protein
MLSLFRPRALSMAIASIVLWVPLVCAQQELIKQPSAPKSSTPSTPAGPVPSPITNAKKVFISNLGMDVATLDVFEHLGGPDRPYNQFYAMVKNWGRYELVSAPGDADVVFEIQATAPRRSAAILQLELTIRDTKTHFVLWNLVESVDGSRRAAFEKNLNRAMNILADDLKKLTAPPPTASVSNN